MHVTRPVVLASAIAAAFAFASCEKKPPAQPAPTPTTGTQTKGDGHDHDHDGHDHTTEIALGTQAIGGYQVAVTLAGKAEAGKEAHVEITLTDGTGKPAAVRAWIGAQDGAGSVKSRADAEGDGYHAHADAPDPLPAGSRLWVEVEDAQGKTAAGGFDLKG